MKKALLGLIMTLTIGTAQAALTVVNPSDITFSGYDGEPATITGAFSSGQWGALSASTVGTFYATYLGNESGYTNSFLSFDSNVKSLFESNDIGTTVATNVNAGLIPFAFFDSVGSFFFNGSNQTPVLGFAIMDGRTTEEYGSFDYIIGFNDSFRSDADYDDFVIGVKFVAAAVPEPETYAMMLIGLGMVGFTARRRKNNQV
jgi:PEP-CTERM motif